MSPTSTDDLRRLYALYGQLWPGLGRIFVVSDILWGDSGKEVVMDWFIKKYGIRHGIRHHGGAGSGRTVYLPNGTKVVLHQLLAVIANGGVGALGPNCVILPEATGGYENDGFGQSFSDPREGLREEVAKLQRLGITVDPNHFIVDPHCAVTLDIFLDWEMRQELTASTNIFTTRRGLAPTYMSLAGRFTVSVADCLDIRRLRPSLDRVERLFQKLPNRAAVEAKLLAWGKWLQSVASIRRTDQWLWDTQNAGHDIALTCVQGALLTVLRDQPFCTSSMTWPPLGLGELRNVIHVGIFKAVPSSIGVRPFPPRLSPEMNTRFVEVFKEQAATTGHGRDLGFPFMPAVREGLRRIRPHILLMTKVDPLAQLGHGIKGWDGMTIDGQPADWWDSQWDLFDPDTPSMCNDRVVLTDSFDLPQVHEPVTGVNSLEAVHPSVLEYIDTIAQRAGMPIPMFKTGPSTGDMVVRDPACLPPEK